MRGELGEGKQWGANLPNAFLHTVGAKWGGKERKKSLNEDGGGRNAIKEGVAFIVRERKRKRVLYWSGI